MKLRNTVLSLVALTLFACGGSTQSQDVTQNQDSAAKDISTQDVQPNPDGAAKDSPTTSPDGAPLPDAQSFDGSFPCLTDQEYFETAIWEPTLSVKCVVCHSEAGIAKDSEMVLLGADEPDFMAQNFETVKAMALKKIGEESTLLTKPTMTHPMGHTGGKQMVLGSVEYLRFEHFVKRMKGEASECESPDPEELNCEVIPVGRPKVRRLSHVEYDNTIEDLFGFPSVWGKGFTVDNLIHGFDNNSEALSVSPLLADQYRKAAEDIAAQAMSQPSQILPCTGSSGQELACVEQFIEDFGPRAFRRPITEADLSRYLAIYNLVTQEDGFNEGVTWVIAAMLQSPHFLYRPEIGNHLGDGEHVLDAYEVASQLSYFLWNTMPDEELFNRAADGTLLDGQTLEQQAQRLVNDPRSHAMLAHFSRQWLDTANFGLTPKDTATYPSFTPAVQDAMKEETARFVKHVIFDGSGALPELFLAQYTLANQTLQDYYGLPAQGGESFQVTSLEDSPYGGILTHGSVMAQHAFANSSSPIHRGVMVRERILCQELPPPPPGIIVQVPEPDPEMTTRERFKAHSEVEPCLSCHQLIDPVGFGFENFDGAGLYRAEENGKAIDVTGEIKGSIASDGSFNGAAELGAHLGESEDVQNCFALHWYRFAYGLDESQPMHCLVKNIQDEFKANDTDIKALIMSLTRQDHFLRRTGDEPEIPPDVTQDTQDGGTVDGGDAVSDEGVPDTQSPPEQPLNVELVIQSEWGAGYCADIFVTNEGTESLQWEFTMPINGEISSLWNANATPMGNETHFTGVDWNGTLAPGETAQFGFCAAL